MTSCIGRSAIRAALAQCQTVAKEIVAKKRAEAIEERYELPSKRPSPKLDEFAKEYFAYYQANRRPQSVQRHKTAYRALQPTFGHQRLAESPPWVSSAINVNVRRLG
jgi:hypothetical protein